MGSIGSIGEIVWRSVHAGNEESEAKTKEERAKKRERRAWAGAGSALYLFAICKLTFSRSTSGYSSMR